MWGDNKIISAVCDKNLPVFQSRRRSEFDEKLHFLRNGKIRERMKNRIKLVLSHTVFPAQIYISEQELKFHTVLLNTSKNEK